MKSNFEKQYQERQIKDVLQVAKNQIQRVLLLESPDTWGWHQLDIVERAVVANLTAEIGTLTGDEGAWSMRDKYISKAVAETRSLMTLN